MSVFGPLTPQRRAARSVPPPLEGEGRRRATEVRDGGGGGVISPRSQPVCEAAPDIASAFAPARFGGQVAHPGYACCGLMIASPGMVGTSVVEVFQQPLKMTPGA